MRDFLVSCLQCAIACAIGSIVWFNWGDDPDSLRNRALGSLLFGFGGLWVVMKIYASIRYGDDTKIDMD
jgi:hypothetical protein